MSQINKHREASALCLTLIPCKWASALDTANGPSPPAPHSRVMPVAMATWIETPRIIYWILDCSQIEQRSEQETWPRLGGGKLLSQTRKRKQTESSSLLLLLHIILHMLLKLHYANFGVFFMFTGIKEDEENNEVKKNWCFSHSWNSLVFNNHSQTKVGRRCVAMVKIWSSLQSTEAFLSLSHTHTSCFSH